MRYMTANSHYSDEFKHHNYLSDLYETAFDVSQFEHLQKLYSIWLLYYGILQLILLGLHIEFLNAPLINANCRLVDPYDFGVYLPIDIGMPDYCTKSHKRVSIIIYMNVELQIISAK